MIAEAVAPVVETAEVVAETVAPVVNTGTLDPKKVAVVALGTGAVIIGGYICYRAIKKRQEAKTVVLINPEPAPVVEEEPAVEEAPAPKAKAKK
jgi:hypothetical protein